MVGYNKYNIQNSVIIKRNSYINSCNIIHIFNQNNNKYTIIVNLHSILIPTLFILYSMHSLKYLALTHYYPDYLTHHTLIALSRPGSWTVMPTSNTPKYAYIMVITYIFIYNSIIHTYEVLVDRDNAWIYDFAADA